MGRKQQALWRRLGRQERVRQWEKWNKIEVNRRDMRRSRYVRIRMYMCMHVSVSVYAYVHMRIRVCYSHVYEGNLPCVSSHTRMRTYM